MFSNNIDENCVFVFGPFRLDWTRDRLWREQEVVELRAKPLMVLRYLLEHPGQIISRSELLKKVWAGVYVTKTALRVCLREIRCALGDEVTSPQYIETVGRQGYRFIGQVSELKAPEQLSVIASRKLEPVPTQETPYFVGRDRELAQLRQWLSLALAGHPHLGFVMGEPGIGKTTLVTTFLRRAQAISPLWIAYGQCVEQFGNATLYLPLLGALERLCQQPGAEQLVRIFEQHAPLWLAQMPTLLSQEQRTALGLSLERIPHERMLRELAAVLAALSTERPLVLVLEDLHWSDSATVEALAYLARRRDLARLLVLATYRPAEIVVGEHPLRRLRQELLAHEMCKELRLELLGENDVKEYVTQRLEGNPLAVALSPLIHERTDGNALFVVNIVEYLLRRGFIQKVGDQSLTPEAVTAIETELPTGLQHLILKEVEGLSPEEQHVLEVASVAGLYFTAAEVAAGDQSDEIRIEAVCDGLARRQRLIKAGGTEEWPDGTITAQYQFVHAVYQQVVCAPVGQARQVRLHRLIGERLETAYGAQTAEGASRLAVHFEQGRDRRAVYYRRQAAEHALRLNAYQEAYRHGAAGIARIETLPDSLERRKVELELRQLVSVALGAIRGFMDDEIEDHLQRAQQLCRELQNDTVLASVLVGLGRIQIVRANRAVISALEQQEKRLAQRLQEARSLAQLHTQLATVATFRGLHVRAEEHYHHVLSHHDPQDLPFLLFSFGGDPLVVASAWSSVSLTLAGQPEQGRSRAAQALVRSEDLDQPLAMVNGLFCAAVVSLLRGDDGEAWRLAHNIDTLTQEYHFPLYKISCALLQGCLAVRGAPEEGIAGLTAGLAQYRAIGAQIFVPFFLSFLAEGYGQQGKTDEALQVVHEALSLTATNLDGFWEAELYRLKGELMLQQARVSESRRQRENRPAYRGQKAPKLKGQRLTVKVSKSEVIG